MEFCSYFYTCVSFQHHPEAISIIDGIAWYALVNSGIIAEDDSSFEDFAPNDFPTIADAINKWKEKGYGLR